jgi:acyl-CoA thioester hydrolase
VTTTDVQIRWGDMDAMGHVNNAVYMTYLECGRDAFFAEVAPDVDWMHYVVRRVDIGFVSQLTDRDGHARVEVELEGVGSSSLRTRERILAGSDGRVAVEATAVIVHLDETKQASAPLPEAVRATFARLSP